MKQDPLSIPKKINLSEDWLAVIIGFLIILLAILGIFGPSGLPVTF